MKVSCFLLAWVQCIAHDVAEMARPAIGRCRIPDRATCCIVTGHSQDLDKRQRTLEGRRAISDNISAMAAAAVTFWFAMAERMVEGSALLQAAQTDERN